MLLFFFAPPGLSSENACALRTDVPCIRVGKCTSSDKATFGSFKVSNSEGNIAAAQPTDGTMCFDDSGIVISLVATDAHTFSAYTNCNSHTWVASDTVEVFIAPVRTLSDNPQWYFELDSVPSGAMYGGLVNNSKGNASTCIDENGCKSSGPLPCTGAAGFAHNMTVTTSNATGSWSSTLFIPWGIFAPQFRPKRSAESGAEQVSIEPWELWRLNFYRYDYPTGPNANFTNYELSAWSATHAPSFHEPSRFGLALFNARSKYPRDDDF